ncbi:MAG: VWA domain-containing protein [Spirochaetota bacterium]|nr:VWA domain-containing protein [Spirochaetota bacterium]
MKRIVRCVFLSYVVIFILFTTTNIRAAKGELIQMAILLDTSGSMDGLIDQARSQLWKIVNELALAKKDGKSPRLEVALYEYGKQSISASEGYLRMIVPLSTDLDKISEELFKLNTNGGDEYCGMVIDAATNGLKWSNDNKDLRLIFIAGNEPFTQGNVDYIKSCGRAIARGVIINTIFCGNYQQGIAIKWKHGADLADGKYMNIDHNQKIVHIKAPQDEEIVKLGQELNNTYISYGKLGEERKMRQKKQDVNAASMSKEALVQRSVAKASGQYINTGWDLVDAIENESVEIDSLKDDELPSEMRKMNKRERKEYIDKMIDKRAELQKRINRLNMERREFVENEMKKRSEQNTLDLVIIKAVHEQAARCDFSFE